MIKDVAFVAYAVRDVPRAVAFYRDVVGLKPGTCNGVAFEVDDIRAAHERLASNGVSVTEVYEFPICFACFAKDPDGNGFALHQRKNGHD